MGDIPKGSIFHSSSTLFFVSLILLASGITAYLPNLLVFTATELVSRIVLVIIAVGITLSSPKLEKHLPYNHERFNGQS